MYYISPHPMPGRMGVDLLIDPVSLGWYRSLGVLKRVVNFISNIQNRLGKDNNIRSKYCTESDLEIFFFLYETRITTQSLELEQIRKYEIINGVMYYRSWFMDKTQFKFADLDKVPFLDAHKILGYIPVILYDSPILYHDDTSN